MTILKTENCNYKLTKILNVAPHQYHTSPIFLIISTTARSK